MESRLSLRGPQEISAAPMARAIVLLRPLADWRGHPLRVLRLEHEPAEIEETLEANSRLLRIFFSFGLMVIAATWLMLQGWVLGPLTKIGESLSRNSPELVTELSADRSEFGRVAGLVRSSFEQRQALETEVRERAAAQAALERSEAALQANLEERSRLGRDLHDGVIQSLYAAGMGLTGVRALLQLAEGGRTLLKLSGFAKFSQQGYPFEDCRARVRRLLAAFGPEQCIWASDWPYLRADFRLDYGTLLALADDWFTEYERRQIMWDTPSKIFKG
jgi:hypothetical protein